MSHTYVICHSNAGDLVTTRPLLSYLASRGPTTCILRHQLAPLISDLPVALQVYKGDTPSVVSDMQWPNGIVDFRSSMHDTLIDLVATKPVTSWLVNQSGRKLGLRFEPNEFLPYDEEAHWHLGSGDLAHVSVRYLRMLPQFRNACSWPSGAFEKGLFAHNFQPISPILENYVALCPGSAKGGENKRMPEEFWLCLAHELRNRKKHLVWFIGPDEISLVSLADPQDEIESGGWENVKAAHRSCAIAITTDTCHMHIRAFLKRHAIALFRRNDFYAWGGYPGYISGIEPPITDDVYESIRVTLAMFDTHNAEGL